MSNARIIGLEPGTTKNRDGREVIMAAACHALLAQCVAGKSADDAVFTRSDGVPVRDFCDTCGKATEAAGIPGLLFHDLRRTAARNRRLGVRSLRKWQTWRRGVYEKLLSLPREDQSDRPCLYSLCALMLKARAESHETMGTRFRIEESSRLRLQWARMTAALDVVVYSRHSAAFLLLLSQAAHGCPAFVRKRSFWNCQETLLVQKE
jgi:hypothetical protein